MNDYVMDVAAVIAMDFDPECQHLERDALYIRFIEEVAAADLGEMSLVARNLLNIRGCAAWYA